MWFGVWTTGEAAMERPLCLLVHYLVSLNALALVAAQGVYTVLLGGRTAVSVAWALASVGAIFVHVLFALLFAWIDGDEIAFGGGVDGGWGDGGADAGSGGDGGGGGGD